MVDRRLVEEGLKYSGIEKTIQKRIINSINDRNYTLADLLTRIYDRVCEETDEVAKKIILQTTDVDMDKLNDYIEDIACDIYGKNTSLGLSFSLILSNLIMDELSNHEVIEEDSFGEEEMFIIHSIAIDKYLKAEEGLYKEEMLDHISNNISRSHSIRALFRGDKEKYDKYLPELYYDEVEQRIFGEHYMQAHVLTSGVTLEALYHAGDESYENNGFSRKDTNKIILAQIHMEEIKLAAYYIQAKKRGFDLQLDYSMFCDRTIESIKKGFSIGEEYKDQFKEKSNVKKINNVL